MSPNENPEIENDPGNLNSQVTLIYALTTPLEDAQVSVPSSLEEKRDWKESWRHPSMAPVVVGL
jgi:hypothetical protein